MLSRPHLKGKPSTGKSSETLKTVTGVGVDLAKKVLQVHAVDAKGDVLVARGLRRGAVLAFFGKLPPCVVAMETCSTSHYWGRALIALGHGVKLIPAAHVKPYVRRNKNDAADAAAISQR
jgi:transposase